MPRYNERLLHLRDLVPRFEKEPSSTHVRNALAAIQRLRENGRTFWQEDSTELSRWREGCHELWNFINRLGERRKEQDLPTALREFIHDFEHDTGRMFQMLCSRPEAAATDPDIEWFSCWCDLVYRLSTYAIVSFWIDDKTEERVTNITMRMNLTTSKTAVEQEHRITKPMQVPKRYRRSSKDI